MTEMVLKIQEIEHSLESMPPAQQLTVLAVLLVRMTDKAGLSKKDVFDGLSEMYGARR